MKTEEITSAVSEYELERGKPMPSKNHALLQMTLGSVMLSKYKDQYSILSELSLKLNNRLFTPDLCIYPKLETNWFEDEMNVTQVPITAIEILSPTQNTGDFTEKFKEYFAAGVKSCWLVQPMLQTIFIIDPDKRISVFHEETLTDPATGITLEMKEIFV